MQQKDYYIILGIRRTASAEEIKSAYRKLAKKYHPDKNEGNNAAEEFFKEIQQAYAILSNEEKRRNYDLKFSTSHSRSARPNKPSTPYTGNAYQYAQQQAQQKNKNFTAKKTKASKPDKSENYQILVSVGLALILLYFVISRNHEAASLPAIQVSGDDNAHSVVDKKTNARVVINMPDHPYSSFFGKPITDSGNKNCLLIRNTGNYEAIVCLTEKTGLGRTIRNQYVNKRSDLKMDEIPDGNYFLKVYYGSDWDATKKIFDTITGGFKNDIRFLRFDNDKNALEMNQGNNKTGTSFSCNEITIDPFNKISVWISANDFFR